MQRMKAYDLPHKGLRNALSQLQLRAGNTDYTDAQQVEQLYRLGKDVFYLLSIHATDENEVVLAELELRCPGASQHDLHDHDEIHEAQHRLEALLERIHDAAITGLDASEDGAEFYLAFSEFHGRYLQHTAEEERVTQGLLWQHFTDDELASHRGKIMGKHSPQTLLTWFRFVLPSQCHAERVGLMTGFRKMAPQPFFQEGLQLVREVLPAKEFEQLEQALG